ncbi:ParM/StbA family protein [Pseudomonas sp. LS-2]|uniref:ParM/StbA family protein n=1 Tax=Pseudomonas sp. LS-2 TaxID=2315859 RepID=UPI000E76FA52|nr:ParM/StbA family protein [Pseudomonas sp. LS-2]RJX72676.1 ParM/StbA family protein [Pseudomonas sp. LS-2]
MATKQKIDQPFVVGLDIGYSNVKRVSGYADEEHPSVVVRPAQAAPVSSLNGNATLKEGEHYVHVNNEPWVGFVNPGRAGVKRELHADYPTTDVYKALFNASISDACQGGQSEIDHLITGLPVSQARKPELVERLVTQLTGSHLVAPKREIVVRKVTVLPQPVGILNHIYAFHPDAEILDESVVLVLDPGFFSVDWVVFRRGDIVRDSSDSSMDAMSALLDAVNNEIAKEFGGNGPGRDKIEIALQSGKQHVYLYGEAVALAPFINRASAAVAPKALLTMKQQMRFLEGEAIDFVLAGGGGGDYYVDAAKEVFPRSKILSADEPVSSVAFGYWLHHT